MAVQYNSKDNTWYTWLDIFKKEIPQASEESINAFEKLAKAQAKGYDPAINGRMEKWIHQNKLADESLINFLNDTNYGTKDLANYQEYLKKSSQGMTFFEKATKKAGTVLKSFGAALGSMAVNWAIGEVISLVAKGISTLTNAQENAIEKAEETINKIEETKKTLSSNKQTIESISSDYERLSKGVDRLGRNVSLSSEEYSNYNEIVNQIADMFPQMVQGYTDEENAIISCKGNVEELTKAYQDQKQAAQDAIITGSSDIFKGFKSKVDHEAGYFWEESGLSQQYQFGKRLASVVDDIDKLTDFYKEVSTEENLLMNDFFDTAGINLGIHLTGEGYAKELQQNKDKILSAIRKLSTDINTEVSKIKPITQAYVEQSDEYKSLDDTEKQNVIDQIISQFDSEFYTKFKDETEMISWVIENVVNKLKDIDGGNLLNEINLALDMQTQFNNDEITVGEYQEKLSALLEAIGSLPKKTQKYIMLLFGIQTNDDGTTSSDVDTMVNNVKDKLQDEFDDKVGTLTIDELEIAANLSINPEETKKNVESELRNLEQGGTVNLLLRPQIDTSELNTKGWDAGEGTATVFSSTYSNEDGTVAVNFTPIIADPKTGEYLGVMSPDELQEYAEGVIAGTREDDLNLQIGAKFEGEDAIDQAVNSAEKVHELHERYFTVDGKVLLSWDELITKIEEYKEAQKSNETDIQFSDIFSLEDSNGTATALSELKDSIDKVTSSYKALKEASEEYRTNGALSLDTIESLMELGDDWLNYLTIEDGQLKINEQAYYDMAQAKLYEMKIQSLQNLSEQVAGLKNVEDAQKWVESQNYDTADSYKTLADSIIQKTLAEFEAKKASATSDSEKVEWQNAIDLYKQEAETINALFDTDSVYQTLSGGSSALSDVLSSAQTVSDLIKSINDDITNNGEISTSTLQNIASTYPVLEKYVIDYMNGVEGSQEELVNQLQSLYQTDVDNYNESLKQKCRNDESFWTDFLNTCADSVNNLANQYGIDLKNYASYAQAEIDINNQLMQSFENLNRVKNASNTIMSDTSNKFSKLTQDQKTQVNSLWAQWQKDYLNDKSSVTRSTMEQELESVLVGRNANYSQKLAKDLAEELYHNIILLPSFQGKYDELNGLTNSWDTYSAQYVDTISSSLGDLDELGKDSKETIDFIEIAVSRLTDTLDKLKTKADDVYSSWGTRNASLADAINKTRQAISLQAQAYNAYMAKANSVGLSNSYKTLVQNGAIRIDDITDDTLKDQISEYQEWYEKAQNCLKTQDDLNDELNELKSQKFDDLKTQYDDIIGRMEASKDLLESQITLLSSSSDYNNIRGQQRAIVNGLKEELASLTKEFNSSGVLYGTEKWYDLQSQIDDVKQQIVDAEATLKDIDNLQFDNIKEAFDFDTTVLEHGIQMIQNKVDLLEMKGQFANESYYNGMIQYTQKELDTLMKERAQLQNILNNTLYKQGTSEWNNMYSTLMDIDEEIDTMTSNLTEFNNAIRDLNWEIFEYLEDAINRITDETDYLIELLSKEDLYDKDNGNLTKYADAAIALHATAYDTYKKQAQDYYEEVKDLQRQLVNGAGKEVLEQYNEMVDAHQEAILAAEDEKQAILDLIEDGYNAQLDALQKLIDKKKEQLQIEKNLFDYQRSIEEKTDNISSLEKQQLAYEGDDSEEAISKIQQIKVQLEEAKADLKETEYDQYLQDTETMLDNLSSDYENWMNDRLDHSDALLAEIVGTVSGKSDEINSTLNEVADEYGTMISDTITSVFNSDSPFTSALTNGLNEVSTSIAGTTSAIEKLVAQVANITKANNSTANTGNGTSSGSSVSSGTSTGKSNNSSTSSNSSNISKTSTSSGSSSNSAWGSWFIRKVDSYPKNKLNVD